jgi:hypothetical protein
VQLDKLVVSTQTTEAQCELNARAEGKLGSTRQVAGEDL